MLELNQKNFKENTKDIAVVDFWAPWCMPCRMLTPAFEQLSTEIDVKFAKVNTEEEPELSEQNNISGIPCIIVFKKGKEAGRIVGLFPKDRLKQKIQELI